MVTLRRKLSWSHSSIRPTALRRLPNPPRHAPRPPPSGRVRYLGANHGRRPPETPPVNGAIVAPVRPPQSPASRRNNAPGVRTFRPSASLWSAPESPPARAQLLRKEPGPGYLSARAPRPFPAPADPFFRHPDRPQADPAGPRFAARHGGPGAPERTTPIA